MNREDIVLRLLHDLSVKFDDLSVKFDDMSVDIGSLKKGQMSLQKGQDELSGRVSSLESGQIDIRLHLENVTDRNIQLLLEQYTPNTNKLNNLVEEVDKIKFDVGNLKKVVASHINEINELLKR